MYEPGPAWMRNVTYKKKAAERLLPLGFGALALLISGLAIYYDPPLIVAARNLVFDSYQRLKPRDYQPVPVRVLDIDEESIKRFGQWPWDRRILARLVTKLQEEGAASIVFDIIFAEPDRTSPTNLLADYAANPTLWETIKALPDNDLVFADAIKRGRVVTSFVLNNNDRSTAYPNLKQSFLMVGDDPSDVLVSFNASVPSLSLFEGSAAGNGAINFLPEFDGVVRKVPLVFRVGDSLYPSIVTEALRVAQGRTNLALKATGASSDKGNVGKTGVVALRVGGITLNTNEHGEMYIYHTRPVPDRTIPIWQFMGDPASVRDRIAGNIVLIGTSAAGLLDMRFSPLGGVRPGVEMHAQAIEQAIAGTYLKRPQWAKGAELLYLLATGMITVVCAAFMRAFPAGVVGGVIASTAVGVSWVAFSRENLLFDPVSPSSMAFVCYLAAAGSAYVLTERKQRFLRQAFSSYVSPNLVEHLVGGHGSLKLGGERRDLTFIFTDLESFTSVVEKYPPDQVMPLLNRYLDDMVGIAFDHGGTLDKVVGDALHVMFSAPIEQKDHADRAIACALAMDAYSKQFQRDNMAAGLPFGSTRIGINSGSVIVGNFGGNRMFDYTAHGNAINMAARLESLNKHIGTKVIAAHDTVRLCSDFSGRPVGNFTLKGSELPITVFQPISVEDETVLQGEAYDALFATLADRGPDARAALEAALQDFPDDPVLLFYKRRLDAGDPGVDIVMDKK